VQEEAESAGGHSVTLCGDMARGRLLISIRYGNLLRPGTLTDPDFLLVKPILGAIGSAAPLKPKAVAAGAQTPVAQAPVVRLVTANVTVEIPSGWQAEHHDGMDWITRPGGPKLFVVLARPCTGPNCNCAVWEKSNRARPDAKFVSNPSYLPPGWNPNVNEEPLTAAMTTEICLDTAEGVLAASVGYDGTSFQDPSFAVVTSFLTRVGRAQPGGPVAPALAQAVTVPVVPAAPSAPLPTSEPTAAPAPEAAPAPAPSPESSEPSWSGESPFERPLRFELAVQNFKATNGPESEIWGGGLHLDGVFIDNDSALSFAFRFGVEASYLSNDSVGLDSDVGLGAGVRLARFLTLIPIVGIGGDKVGAMDWNYYFYPQLTARVQVQSIGIEAVLSRLKRSGEQVPHETRIAFHLLKALGEHTYSLGIQFRNYGDFRMLGGTLGTTF